MFSTLDIFATAKAMAVHAGQKQAVVAQNIANADTPGYRARGVVDFKTLHKTGSDGAVQKATRPGHLNGATAAATSAPTYEIQDAAAPNGNTVSLEGEMLQGVAAKRQHDRALAIYKSSLGILRSAMRTR